jgi:hypothetical protein
MKNLKYAIYWMRSAVFKYKTCRIGQLMSIILTVEKGNFKAALAAIKSFFLGA